MGRWGQHVGLAADAFYLESCGLEHPMQVKAHVHGAGELGWFHAGRSVRPPRFRIAVCLLRNVPGSAAIALELTE